MKTLPFLSVLLPFFLTLSPVRAQKVKPYRVWVTLVTETRVKGTLYAAEADGLLVVREDLSQMKIAPESIGEIRLRKEGQVGKGAWMGAVSGLVVGMAVGFASTEDAYITQAEGGFAGAVIGAPVGTLLGMAILSGKEKYMIDGDKTRYASLLPDLQRHAMY